MRSLIKIIFGNVVFRVIVFAAFAIYGYFTLSDSESDDTVRDASGEVIEGGQVGFSVLHIGDCLQFPTGVKELEEGDEGIEFEQLSVVPCTVLHDAEIFSSRVLSGTYFPGDDMFGGELSEFCADDYQTYTGVEYLDSPHLIYPLYPTQESWDQGEKEITCAVGMENGEKLGASVRG